MAVADGSSGSSSHIYRRVPSTPSRADRARRESRLINAFLPFTPAEVFLEGQGMLNARVLGTLRELEVSSRSDLAYIFLTEAEAGEADLREQWLAARRESLPDVAALARPCVRLPPPPLLLLSQS